MSWGARTAQVYDGTPYVPGALYEVQQACRLSGWVPARGGHNGWAQRLTPGDVVECRGYGPGFGSDPGYGIEWVSEQSRAVHASACDIWPQVGGAFAYRPRPGLVAVLLNQSCPLCTAPITRHTDECALRELLVPA